MDSGIIESDFLVVGSGLAGLYSALNAANHGSVTLVTKSDFSASSSYWAQGGVAAVLDPHDSFESHINDTLQAGRGYCDVKAVEILIKEGATAMHDLIDLGMNFDKTGLNFDLGLEGGHSARRVFHANGASTGKALIDFLLPKIISHPNIRVVEYAFVYQLITRNNICYGADFYSVKANKNFRAQSPITILATGGYSGLFSRTTNPHTSTGDGLWLAYNEGAILKDVEFVQFHPTVFYSDNGNSFLISEAVRGEGAKLMNQDGEYFMKTFPEADLSPRDMVSKEIFKQVQNQSEPFVYLDVRHLDYLKLKESFPIIMGRVEAEGIDIQKEGIPVSPAAHYCIGGVETDLNGSTNLYGLYACGEVAVTGVHGANRLASNSLLECLVFGKRAVLHAISNKNREEIVDLGRNELKIATDHKNQFLKLKNKVSSILNQYAGIERSNEGLQFAQEELFDMKNGIDLHDSDEYYIMRIQGMINVAIACVQGALQREESRGVHFRSDYPKTNTELKHPFRFKRNSGSESKKDIKELSIEY